MTLLCITNCKYATCISITVLCR